MPAKPSYMIVFQKVDVAGNTNYASGLWAKGSGRFQVQILDRAWNEAHPLATLDVTATDQWQQIDLPAFSSGSNTFVYFVIRDRLGGGGTVYLDDCYLHSIGAGG